MSNITTVSEVKVKLMEATGDLPFVAEQLGISVEEADVLRTYKQYKFGDDSPIIKALLTGVEAAVKVANKSSLEGEAKEQVIKAVQSIDAEALASALISGQNTAIKAIRGIPTKVAEKVAVSKKVEEVLDV